MWVGMRLLAVDNVAVNSREQGEQVLRHAAAGGDGQPSALLMLQCSPPLRITWLTPEPREPSERRPPERRSGSPIGSAVLGGASPAVVGRGWDPQPQTQPGGMASVPFGLGTGAALAMVEQGGVLMIQAVRCYELYPPLLDAAGAPSLPLRARDGQVDGPTAARGALQHSWTVEWMLPAEHWTAARRAQSQSQC